jgi:hypothetical protein
LISEHLIERLLNLKVEKLHTMSNFEEQGVLSTNVDSLEALEPVLFINTHLVIIVEVVNGEQKSNVSSLFVCACFSFVALQNLLSQNHLSFKKHDHFKRKFMNSLTLRELLSLEFQYGDDKASEELVLCFVSEDGRYAVQARNNHARHHPRFTVRFLALQQPPSTFYLSVSFVLVCVHFST